MKKIVVVIAALALVTFITISGCLQGGKGTLVLQITDAPSMLNITHANVTLSHIEVHLSAGGSSNGTAGWHTIVNYSKTYDLIKIIGVKELLGRANISAGIYTQVRLTIEQCVITVNGTQYNCSIPSDAVTLNQLFLIKANRITKLTLDFDAQKSITQIGSHKFDFKPVIRILRG